MISVVIRNKNEGVILEKILKLLRSVYADDISEIIVVDNLSTDNSLAVAAQYNCTCVTIENFTYGRAINMGIAAANEPYVLLLSAHAVPVGNSFFKNTKEMLKQDLSIAGLRYINSFQNYWRAAKDNYEVKDGLRHGLMAACAIVNTSVWEKIPFDESLSFSEDKVWSADVMRQGFKIKDINETFFYSIRRDATGNLNRWENETLADHIIHKKKFPGSARILGGYLKKSLLQNPSNALKEMRRDLNVLKAKFRIKNKINKN